ncbi:MAG: TetR/AcrR family transcriptional regulator [Pseudomonadota bacterium]|nr:TetR/AcrR family transcriptional regulator [Pseudomonadota bacterium]
MARGRAAGYDDQQDAITAQAAQLFARHGYPATSMNQIAKACGLSKATLYHYWPHKYALLVHIAEGHVSHLLAIVQQALADPRPPEVQLRRLIRGLVQAYAGAQAAHRVLTEDVKFLEPIDRDRVLGQERAVVAAFAGLVAQLRPDLDPAHLTKPLTMLLFGMVNWMFTWMKPGGVLDHAAMAPVVADLFIGGLSTVRIGVPAAIVMAAEPFPIRSF